jgi:hypothetical protein
LGRLLDGQLITFTLAARAKKQGYYSSAAFSWWVFWELLQDPMAGKPWGYFSQGRLQSG